RRLAEREDHVAVSGAATLADRDNQVSLGRQLFLQWGPVVERQLPGRQWVRIGQRSGGVAGEDDWSLQQLRELTQLVGGEAGSNALAGPDNRATAPTNSRGERIQVVVAQSQRLDDGRLVDVHLGRIGEQHIL